ncbi:membrane protein, partial [Aneurinibacillus migulanus]
KIRPYAIILIFSLATTLLEYVMLVFGKVSYGQNWNILWTFWSYVLPYFIIYRYYIALKKLGLY